MRLDKLLLDLRPRPHAQALDLGFELLRAHAGATYGAWLALWLPLVVLCSLLALLSPSASLWMMLALWWIRPLLERAPLYVLSRAVFGERVGWRQALCAWPRQLGGGWLLMLTWWRPFIAHRGLYQAVWQLEGARGAVAAERRRVLAQDGTARAAYWFAATCAHFEVILQLGLLAFLGVFVSAETTGNPFAFLSHLDQGGDFATWLMLLSVLVFGVGGAIVGPIYTACCFTLYLNRRAQLEAWDIEIMLRQMRPPQSGTGRAASVLAGMLLPLLLAALSWQPAPASAAAPLPPGCELPQWAQPPLTAHASSHTPQQARLRSDLRRLYEGDELRRYDCVQVWVLKGKKDKPPQKKAASPTVDMPGLMDPALLGLILKMVVIAVALILLAWVLYKYRDQIPALRRRTHTRAVEIGGLDIRPESLPDDVAAAVLALWQAGEQRAALALLYRATLSRLVQVHGLFLAQGATEGDCLRQARARLDGGTLQLVEQSTTLWLNAAWGQRWPEFEQVEACAMQWREQLGARDGGGGA